MTGSTGSTGTSQTTDTGSETDPTTGEMMACDPIPPQGDTCVVDADCQIAGDCCSCVAYNPMMSGPGNCGGACGMNVCEQIGATQAYCDSGVCRVLGGSCDQTAVTCDLPPPACPPGELPQVQEECYTGSCISVAFCDWVPDCSDCPVDQFCVIRRTEACDQHDCVPFVAKCGGGGPSCGCEGLFVCQPPFGACLEENGAVVCM
ncbi:MAG: hypothetical protein AAGF11_13055 [Myxococcota bacterium]